VYRIESATVVSADITCFTAGSAAAVNRWQYTADQRKFAPVTRGTRAAHDPGYGRGLEGREEGDCNLTPASQYWVLATTPPPAGIDINRQLSITLTFLRITQS